MAKRRIGYSVKKLRSGRFQLVLRDPLTGKQFGMGSYGKEADADAAGIDHVAKQNKGGWLDPRNGEVKLVDYLNSWIETQAATGKHSEKYSKLVRYLADTYILPTLGSVPLVDLRPQMVGLWYDRLVAQRQPNPGLVPAKSYRLLHAVLNEAVRNELIVRNPCLKKSAGVEDSPERPLLEPEQIKAIAEAIVPWWKTLILTSAYCALRFGECQDLKVENLDLERGTTSIVKAKTRAGVRTVAIPPPLIPLLQKQVVELSTDYVFVGPKGGRLQRSNFTADFRTAADGLGLTHVHFHDLRHAGGTLAAQLGATEKELMSRLGHASPNAARRYQHAAQRRDQELADRLGGLL